ncbi:MAG: aspartate carbamoyltransferase regulatory subunit [Candidatus Hodarchaeales archaeon]
MTDKKSNDKQLTVKKIDNGIVIDHIVTGGSFFVLKALNIDEHYPHSVFIAINVPSKKLGRKDVLKIRNIRKEDLNLDILGLLISGSNLIYIENYNIVQKEKIRTPKKAHGIIKCPGISCITNLREDVETEFTVIGSNGNINRENLSLRCVYCDKMFKILENISLIQ